MAAMWRVRLFDGPVLEGPGGEEVARFRSVKVQALLAFLALRLGHRCPREEIADALWPEEADEKATANRLRVTLASLRRQLEPPGVAFGTVLDASVPGCVILRAAAVACDVSEFDRAYAAGDLAAAGVLLRGSLAPGLYDEWIRLEQLRFEALREELAPYAGSVEPRAAVSVVAPAVSHRLPLYLTRFVGREAESQRLREKLSESRLVTLTGPGGIGKTRLAVETAAQGERAAVFVSLALLDDLERAPEAILRALGISSRTDLEPVEQLVEILGQRPATLLILDNAENQVEATAGLVWRLLTDVPELRALVTSRQRLELAGEVTIAVSPLETPPDQGGLRRLLEAPSALLFVDRAQSAVPDFVVSERNAPAIEAICRRLEGMPLAIELAAARVAVQSPAQIAAGLEANMMDLKSRQRGLSERHRSLRAAIQGSYEMLSPDLQQFFARLSVFRGGWTAEAARVVCGEPEAEDRLEELLVRSLVLVAEDEASGGVRYSFLGPLRAFAEERLAESRLTEHAHYFLELAGAVTEDDLRTLMPLDSEEQNLRLALGSARDARYWRGLAGALLHAFVRGRHRQALQWIEETWAEVAKVSEPELRFRWRYAAGQILPDVGRFDETNVIATEMREDAEAQGDRLGAIYAAVIHAFVLELKGQVGESLAVNEEALVRAREQGDRHLLETCLSHRSGALHVYGAQVGAETELGRAALAEAEVLAEEMCRLVPPYSRRVPLGPLMLAAAVWPQGRLPEAYEFFKDSEAAAVRLGTTTELMYAFISEAVIVAAWGHLDSAAQLYGAFLSLQEQMGYSLERAQSARPPWIERLAVQLNEELGAGRFEALVAVGRQTPPAVLSARRIN